MDISFSKSAIDDLKNIKEYYIEQGVPDIGQNFVSSIVEHIKTLSSHPEIGRVVPEFNDEAIRELIHAPFRVVYMRDETAIKIVRVWRSERLLRLPEDQ
ncbi:addiction module toxin RelE [Oleiphilus sp. HI0125]|uniref:type II toxin-antitoxin system RelE/ParE family toxin n=1 Tax=Oleiphilus sp. HI0125 TaxID=1822266 RepID=UPI0007C3E773|nr:type II toxin-antitoxin system RelE/ParE family toxin [Oleiphilus sp. HI0125]KZZ62860.1 addiction module toxin RelE [Oleiphilus sp. HI0125]